MVYLGDLVAIMEERDFDRDAIDADSLESEAIQLSTGPKQLDLSNGGLSRIPDSAIAFPAIEELILSQNQLTNTKNNMILLHRFPKLHILHLECNELRRIPRELLELTGLTYLNLSDNKIEKIPADISQLIKMVKKRKTLRNIQLRITRIVRKVGKRRKRDKRQRSDRKDQQPARFPEGKSRLKYSTRSLGGRSNEKILKKNLRNGLKFLNSKRTRALREKRNLKAPYH